MLHKSWTRKWHDKRKRLQISQPTRSPDRFHIHEENNLTTQNGTYIQYKAPKNTKPFYIPTNVLMLFAARPAKAEPRALHYRNLSIGMIARLLDMDSEFQPGSKMEILLFPLPSLQEVNLRTVFHSESTHFRPIPTEAYQLNGAFLDVKHYKRTKRTFLTLSLPRQILKTFQIHLQIHQIPDRLQYQLPTSAYGPARRRTNPWATHNANIDSNTC